MGGDTKNENYPYLMRDFRQLGRRAVHISAGNKCTVILAGPYRPPSLVGQCVARVQRDEILLKRVRDGEGDLPPEVRALVLEQPIEYGEQTMALHADEPLRGLGNGVELLANWGQ